MKVAAVDSRIDAGHDDLAANIVPAGRKNFLRDTDGPGTTAAFRKYVGDAQGEDAEQRAPTSGAFKAGGATTTPRDRQSIGRNVDTNAYF